eukprot:gene10758-13171_t
MDVNNFGEIVTESERLTIHKVTLNDTQFIYDLWNDPVVVDYISNRGIDTLELASKYIEDAPMKSYRENGYGIYVLRLKTTGEPIGMCGFVKYPPVFYDDEINIGYSLLSKYRSQGYVFESATTLMEYGRKQYNMTNIIGVTTQRNLKSKAVLEKLGLKYKGTFREPKIPDELVMFVHPDIFNRPQTPQLR